VVDFGDTRTKTSFVDRGADLHCVLAHRCVLTEIVFQTPQCLGPLDRSTWLSVGMCDPDGYRYPCYPSQDVARLRYPAILEPDIYMGANTSKIHCDIRVMAGKACESTRDLPGPSSESLFRCEMLRVCIDVVVKSRSRARRSLRSLMLASGLYAHADVPVKKRSEEVHSNVSDQQVAQSGMWPTPPKRVNSISSHQPWPHNNVLKLLREKVGSFLQLVRFN
jgi:hypothetical protein